MTIKLDTTAIVLAFVGYALAAVWWAATVQTQVQQIQAYIDRTAQHINNLDYSSANQNK